MRTTTSDPAATVVGSLSATAQPERVATTTELVRVRCLDIADFAESLSARLLSETPRAPFPASSTAPDDRARRGVRS